MSRHSFTTLDKQYDITIGWDPALSTFFGQVEGRGGKYADEPIVWMGVMPHQYSQLEPFLEQFICHAATFDIDVKISESLRQQLRVDQQQQGSGYSKRPQPIRAIVEKYGKWE